MTRSVLKTKTFQGSYYKIGLERAKYLKGFPFPKSTPGEVEFARRCREVVEGIYPPILGEFEGLLDGGGFDRDDFSAYFFARKEGILRGCTSFAVLPSITRDKTTIVGRNYDWIYSDLKWCELRYIRPDGAYPTVSYTHHWAGSPDVLNSEGLCVAMASLPRRDARKPGLQWNLVIDIMMDTCRDVAQARSFITKVPHLRSMSYLIADALGEAIVVEALPDSVTIREPENGFVIATNHRIGREPVDSPESNRRSQIRYRRAEEMIAERAGFIDEEVAKRILRDHQCHICSGIHGNVREREWGTIWSLICKPQEGGFWIAPGHPCEVEYEKVERP